MKQFAVNRELFPIKAHFFFSSAGKEVTLDPENVTNNTTL